MTDLYQRVADGLIKGNTETVNKSVNEALDKGITAKEILDKGSYFGNGYCWATDEI